MKQECIPVGCLPSAAVASQGMYSSMHWAGGCLSQHVRGRGVCIPACTDKGVSAQGGGCLPGGCLPGEGDVCLGGVYPGKGMSAQGGVCPGGCLPRGVCVS